MFFVLCGEHTHATHAQKHVLRNFKFDKNETERGVPCRFDNPRSVPFRSQVNTLFTCRTIAQVASSAHGSPARSSVAAQSLRAVRVR